MSVLVFFIFVSTAFVLRSQSAEAQDVRPQNVQQARQEAPVQQTQQQSSPYSMANQTQAHTRAIVYPPPTPVGAARHLPKTWNSSQLVRPQSRDIGIPVQSLAEGIRLPEVQNSQRIMAAAPLELAHGPNSAVRRRIQAINDSIGVCACGIDADSREAGYRPIGKTSIKDLRGKRFAISVVNYEYALKIFHYMTAQEQIPFGFPQDGCFARAHEMSYLLEKQGIITGKVMATGVFRIQSDKTEKGAVTWGFHVAPVIVVDDGTGRSVWVIDPSLFTEPVPLESWLAILTSHPKASLKNAYLTTRYVYHPSRKNKGIRTWDPEDREAAKKLMREHRLKIKAYGD